MAFSRTNNIFVSQMLALPLPTHGTPAYWDVVQRTTYVLDAMKAAATHQSSGTDIRTIWIHSYRILAARTTEVARKP